MSKSQPMCTLRSQIPLGCPTPPILGQTIDRCITSQLRLKPRVVVRLWYRTPASRARTLCWATEPQKPTYTHSLTHSHSPDDIVHYGFAHKHKNYGLVSTKTMDLRMHVMWKVHTSNSILCKSQLWFLACAGRLTDNFGYCNAYNANLNA